MKKQIVFLAALLFVAIISQSHAQVGFGLRGGAGMFNLDVKDIMGDPIEDLKLVPRFHGGLFVEFNISSDFVIQPSLLFSSKGSMNEVIGRSTGKIDYLLNYLEIPINLIYKARLDAGSFFVGLGPYMGYGLTGKLKYTEGTIEEVVDIKFNSEWQEGIAFTMKPIEFGANVLAGFEFPMGLSIGLHAQLGLTNSYVKPVHPNPMPIKSETEDNASIKNIGFSLSLGYRLF